MAKRISCTSLKKAQKKLETKFYVNVKKKVQRSRASRTVENSFKSMSFVEIIKHGCPEFTMSFPEVTDTFTDMEPVQTKPSFHEVQMKITTDEYT